MASTMGELIDQLYSEWAELHSDKASLESKEAFTSGFWYGIAYVIDAVGGEV